MADDRLIGIGASAGGVETLLELVGGFDADLPAAVFVVLHQAAEGPAVLPQLLDRRCALPVEAARHGEPVRPGHVVVAPPDRHLLVRDGQVVLSRGPKENGHRPGVDPLLRSLALEAGPGATGVILSGLLDDGAAGLLEIVRHGGAAVVQDPDEALFDSMPRAALEQVPGAVVRPVAGIGATLGEIVSRVPLGTHRPTAQLVYEVTTSLADDLVSVYEDPPGPVAGVACPDCSGPLFDLGSDRLHHYRCRTGHAWSEQSLGAEQDVAVERALYVALRALEDKAALAHRIAARAGAGGSERVAERSRRSAHSALRAASTLRRTLNQGTEVPDTDGPVDDSPVADERENGQR